MAVYIAAHKACAMPTADGYIPLHAGAACSERLPYTRDDSGDHISHKNPHYCELTALYWVWKNTTDEYKGLVHYRRLFMEGGQPLTPARIRALLATHDVIVPRIEYLRESAAEEFALHSGHAQDLALLRQAVAAVDAAVLPAYDRVMADNRLVLYNMLIARRDWFDGYCAWLFAVLAAMEPQVDMTGYTAYQQRLYGFLGERLLNVYLAHTAARVHHQRVVNTERRAVDTLRLSLRRVKNRLLFALRRAEI